MNLSIIDLLLSESPLVEAAAVVPLAQPPTDSDVPFAPLLENLVFQDAGGELAQVESLDESKATAEGAQDVEVLASLLRPQEAPPPPLQSTVTPSLGLTQLSEGDGDVVEGKVLPEGSRPRLGTSTVETLAVTSSENAPRAAQLPIAQTQVSSLAADLVNVSKLVSNEGPHGPETVASVTSKELLVSQEQVTSQLNGKAVSRPALLDGLQGLSQTAALLQSSRLGNQSLDARQSLLRSAKAPPAEALTSKTPPVTAVDSESIVPARLGTSAPVNLEAEVSPSTTIQAVKAFALHSLRDPELPRSEGNAPSPPPASPGATQVAGTGPRPDPISMDTVSRAPMVRVEQVGDVVIKSIQYQTGRSEEVIRVRLIPESLGDLQIVVRSTGSTMDVHLVASTHAAREMLEQQLPGLREMLANQGVELNRVAVSTGVTSEGANQHASSRSDANSSPSNREFHESNGDSTGGRTPDHSERREAKYHGNLNVLV